MTSRDELQRIIRLHRVVFVRAPGRIVEHGEIMVVGYDLSLFGTHGEDHAMSGPGCGECSQVFEDLRLIANAVAPPPTEQTRVTIVPFLGTVHFAKERHDRPDIELKMEFRHRTHGRTPVDDCETACLQYSLTELKRLGVPERRWKTIPPPQ